MRTIDRLRHVWRRLWFEQTIMLLVRPEHAKVHSEWLEQCPGSFCTVSEMNLGDCLEIEDAHYLALYQKMLMRGDYGQFGYLNGKCVYRAWLQRSGDIEFQGCSVLTLKEREGYSCYDYCAPSARGNGFQAAGIARVIQKFPELTIYTLILPTKPWSLRNYLRNGFEPQSLITVKRRFFYKKLVNKTISLEERKRYRTDY